MKNKSNVYPFILFVGCLFLLIATPKPIKQKISGTIVSITSPLWNLLINTKNFFFKPESIQEEDTLTKELVTKDVEEKIAELKFENQKLKQQLTKMQQLFKHELNLIIQFASLSQAPYQDLSEEALFHKKSILALLKKQLQATPARVIYRSTSSWSSSLWVDVGSEHGIQKNSPVVSGKSIIGLIDYVGKTQSRVRLITDSGLCPSVRVSRGESQSRFIKEKVHFLSGLLSTEQDLFDTPQEKQLFLNALEKLRKKLRNIASNVLLAKGELQGKSSPVWRSTGQHLKGIGFNYDFADEEGPARDLRTGKAINYDETINEEPIVQENDLLVTTGYDGVFPAGFPIATVAQIKMLREGDYYFELEATPTSDNLDELDFVFVLPPQPFNPEDQPSIFD